SMSSSAVAHARRYPARSGLWGFQGFHAGDKVVESRLVGRRVDLRSRRIVTGCLRADEGGLQPGHITNRMIVIGVGERGRFTRHAPPRRRALRSIHVAPQLNQSGLNLVMVVRVPFSTNNRISRKLSVPLSHKNSYPRLLSSSPGRRLSFPRTSSGTVNELDEVSVI